MPRMLYYAYHFFPSHTNSTASPKARSKTIANVYLRFSKLNRSWGLNSNSSKREGLMPGLATFCLKKAVILSNGRVVSFLKIFSSRAKSAAVINAALTM